MPPASTPRRSVIRTPHAEPGMRIGLLGGSFNPPHEAHLLITETALKRLGLAQVWWLVTPGNPLKSKADLAPVAERVAAARALANDARVVVTDFEKALPSPYTASTLAFLAARHPRAEFVWLMGADNLAQIHRWRSWRSIFRLMPVAVVDRPGWRLKAMASPAARAFTATRLPESRAPRLALEKPPAWTFLTGPLSSLSSTMLRAARKAAAGNVSEKPRIPGAGAKDAKSKT
jgi:nicotinate-nucleotide adenylyltransferase